MNPLDEIADRIAECKACDLCYHRTNTVPGWGHIGSGLVIVGEAPGFYEDHERKPFVGQSGKTLDRLLEMAGRSRDHFWITNIVKCRPPRNRDPKPNEVSACRPFLIEQLNVLQPTLIMTLGRFALDFFYPDSRISEMHGKVYNMGDILFIPMYHPASMRSTQMIQTVEQDFSRLKIGKWTVHEIPMSERMADYKQGKLI